MRVVRDHPPRHLLVAHSQTPCGKKLSNGPLQTGSSPIEQLLCNRTDDNVSRSKLDT